MSSHGERHIGAKRRAGHISLEEYQVVIDRLMADVCRNPSGEPHVFNNHGANFARIVVSAMINNAEHQLLIFANELHHDVYDAKVIKAFLGRCPDADCRIVVERDHCESRDTSALKELTDEIEAGTIKVSVADRQPKDSNFAVVDGRHVRLERSQATREATIILRDSELGEDAVDCFTRLEAGAVPFSLSE